MFYSAFEASVNATGFGVSIPGRRASAADRHDQAIGLSRHRAESRAAATARHHIVIDRRVPATLEFGASS
jgi:hypothetical protein